MIGPLLWLIYLLTYLDTERALLSSRRQFGFSDEDRILMENVSNKLQETGTTAR